MREPRTIDPSAPEARALMLDLEQRAAPATLIYIAVWVVIGVGADLQRHPVVLTLGSVLVGGTAVARLVLHRRFEALVTTRPRLARLLLHVGVLSSVALAGVMSAAALAWRPLEPMRELIMLTGVTICGVGTLVHAMDPVFRVGVPLVVLGPIGVAIVLVPDPPFSPAVTVALLLCFTAYLRLTSRAVHDDYWRAAAATRELHQRTRELEWRSATDGLTGVSNRTAFEERLAETWAISTRHGLPVSLLLLDLDHFKRINDTYGHPFGDRCLVRVAATVEGAVERGSDVVARYGGEEFVALLPGTAEPAALQLAERVRAAVQALELDVDGSVVPLTCSVGVATMAPVRAGGPPSALVAAADAALYRAKAGGRNRVERATGGERPRGGEVLR